jgi:CheY-like chemotaxis protein
LIAEDSKINQKVLDWMGMKNFDIVDNGQRAVVQEAAKEYDLILIDMQMPVMGGVEVTRFIVERKEWPHPRNLVGDGSRCRNF